MTVRTSTPKLVQVYNADGDKVSILLSALHKVVSPSTYECSLCSLTHGALTMKSRWRDFLKTIDAEPVEYHRDEFTRAFPGYTVQFPALLVQFEDERPAVLVTAIALNAIKDIDDLIDLVRLRLAQAEDRHSAKV